MSNYNLSEYLSIKEIHYSKRLTYLRSLLEPLDLGAEIGPSHSPIAPRKLGYNTKIVDVIDTESLKRKYEQLSVDTSLIESVDYVWKGEPLNELIDNSLKFEYIVASHVIEHIPNPIAFFRQCEKILSDNGILILVIPDKRRCFDFLRPLSTTGQFVQAYLENATTHSIQAIYDFHAGYVTSSDLHSWSSDEQKHDDLRLLNNELAAYQACKESIKKKQYVDVHGWVFSPSSFLLIYRELRSLCLINIQLQTFSVSSGHEFYAVLKKTNENIDILANIDRLTLHQCILSELSETKT